MNVKDFISKFNNHPVLFVGTGVSLRYLKGSFTWDGLLKHISNELTENEESYLDLKDECYENNVYDYKRIATLLEDSFNEHLRKDRDGKFKLINDEFYEQMKSEKRISRLKLFIADTFKELDYKTEMNEELQALKRVRKNIGSVITTNYDCFIEEMFEFRPLIGNDILLSNPYGSVYKIHGCTKSPERIIITEEDYENFGKKYELIRAQLLSLFIHNPIVFIGYSINDDNIKEILKTIFTYVEANSPEAEKIRSNFLLIEYEAHSTNLQITEHDIVLDAQSTIRINKIKTDNYLEIFNSLADLQLPVTAMDIRKVQSVVKEIYSGGSIKVSITENLDQLDNGDKVLVIGSHKTIQYEFQTTSELMQNYFNIIDESNAQLLSLIDKIRINKKQYFPIHEFSKINQNIGKKDVLKQQQIDMITNMLSGISSNHHTSINDVIEDSSIPKYKKNDAIIYGACHDKIELDDLKDYLLNFKNKQETNYRKLLCVYDWKMNQ